MEEQNVNSVVKERNLFQQVFTIIKRNILLLLIIVIVATAVGWVYANLRTPNYIAEAQVLYSMGDGQDVTNDVNTTHAYKETVMDFCDNGVVIDRANFYYKSYVKNSSYATLGVDAFIADVHKLERNIASYIAEIGILEEREQKRADIEDMGTVVNNPTLTQIRIEIASLGQQAVLIKMIRNCYLELDEATTKAERDILSETIQKYEKLLVRAKRGEALSEISTVPSLENADGTVETSEEKYIVRLKSDLLALQQNELYYQSDDSQSGNEEYIFSKNVGIKKYDSEEVENAFAFGVTYLDNKAELSKEKVKVLILAFGVESSYFFTGLSTTIEDMGVVSCSVDMSKTKIIVVSVVVGVVLGLLIVFTLQTLDKTIKTKEQAEELTGCAVLACIESQEV